MLNAIEVILLETNGNGQNRSKAKLWKRRAGDRDRTRDVARADRRAPIGYLAPFVLELTYLVEARTRLYLPMGSQ